MCQRVRGLRNRSRRRAAIPLEVQASVAYPKATRSERLSSRAIALNGQRRRAQTNKEMVQGSSIVNLRSPRHDAIRATSSVSSRFRVKVDNPSKAKARDSFASTVVTRLENARKASAPAPAHPLRTVSVLLIKISRLICILPIVSLDARNPTEPLSPAKGHQFDVISSWTAVRGLKSTSRRQRSRTRCLGRNSVIRLLGGLSGLFEDCSALITGGDSTFHDLLVFLRPSFFVWRQVSFHFLEVLCATFEFLPASFCGRWASSQPVGGRRPRCMCAKETYSVFYGKVFVPRSSGEAWNPPELGKKKCITTTSIYES